MIHYRVRHAAGVGVISIADGPFEVVIVTSTLNSQSLASRTITVYVPAPNPEADVVEPNAPPSIEYVYGAVPPVVPLIINDPLSNPHAAGVGVMSMADGPFDVVMVTSTLNSQSLASRTITVYVPAANPEADVVEPLQTRRHQSNMCKEQCRRLCH